ncbi:MAG TPA: hypothetical protein C5S37_06485 [Methanophagales archaeon]|nr:hypothetical protein [Methanophagales archaeon]
MPFCPSCGERVDEDDVRCPYCHKRLKKKKKRWDPIGNIVNYRPPGI